MPLTFEDRSKRLTQTLSYFRAAEIAYRKGITQLVELQAESREPVLLAHVEDLAKVLYGIDTSAVAVDLAIEHLARQTLRQAGAIDGEPANIEAAVAAGVR